MAIPPLTPRFLVAKYAPDLSRMEPRNIGVILWVRGAIHTQFLDESSAAAFINKDELSNYTRWVTFWNDRVSGQSVSPSRGRPVLKENPESLNALLTTQKGNYILDDAGEMIQSLRKKQGPDAVQFLFHELVSRVPLPKEKRLAQSRTLIAKCESLFDKAGILGSDEFKRNQRVECSVFGVPRHLPCDYYYGNGTPDAIFQRAILGSEDNVLSAATTIHSLTTESGILEASKCRFLIQNTDIEGASGKEKDRLKERFECLSKVCQVISVDSPDAVHQVLSVLSANRP